MFPRNAFGEFIDNGAWLDGEQLAGTFPPFQPAGEHDALIRIPPVTSRRQRS